MAICLVVAAVSAQRLSARLHPELGGPFAQDVWFQADLMRTSSNMTSRFTYQDRTKVHPIASLLTIPISKLLAKLVPQEPFRTAQLLLALVAGVWAAAIFALCRSLGGGRIAAVAFTALAVSSAAFVFWFSVPETYGLGSLTILAALIVAARADRRPASTATVAGVSAATLSMTVTNWMAGLALAAAALPWRRALRASGAALGIVAVLAIVQLVFARTSQLFFMGSSEELDYVNVAAAGHWWNKLAAMALHAFVMPDLRILPAVPPAWPQLSVQMSAPALQTVPGAAALLAWGGLLVIGAWGAWQSWVEGRRRVFVAVVLATLAGQVALHLVYGEETFLYVLHAWPAFVGLAMLGWFTRWRTVVVALALGAAALAGVHNVGQFAEAVTLTAKSAFTERKEVLRAMAARPSDPWPRGTGHVLLGEPGSALQGKAYHEPGASFSPAPGSFGVSIWMADASGQVISTSETLPVDAIEQRFIHGTGPGFPALRTVTPYFAAEWSHVEGRSALRLTPGPRARGGELRVMLRSVGPAGGPLRRIEADGDRLRLDDRWSVEMSGAKGPWHLGDEADGGLRRLRGPSPTSAESAGGWLVASAPVDPASGATLIITRHAPAAASATFRADTLPLWRPAVPDADFAESALAQQAHLLIGLTDGETRPGEPLNYTFPWIRDAAYVVVALARSGQTAIARRLALQLAERDFTGGFGAEADGPGLSTWAIGEVSQVLRDPAFDRAVWPHVRRKLDFVKGCAEAKDTVRALSQNVPIGPSPTPRRPNPICEKAWRGLIVGRMDNSYPVFFVNATAYAGLVQGAGIARRLDEAAQAAEWTARAAGLKAAWQQSFLEPSPPPAPFARGLRRRLAAFAPAQFPDARRDTEIEDNWLAAKDEDHTFVNGEWPVSMTSGSAPVRAAYLEAMTRRWTTGRDAAGDFRKRPLWTYFDFAEAHQWLLLDRPDRAWQTLRWFFRHPSSPGLFSWWEGEGEENTSHRWLGVRGWVRGEGGVTPHYWTAAEALLLQLDMLARVDENDPARPVVLGSGVPDAWMASPLDSGTVSTPRGRVRWRLQAGAIEVELEDPAVPVRLAPPLAGRTVRVVPMRPRDPAPAPG